MMKKKILGILLSLSILSLAAGCSASKTEPEKAVSAGEEQAGTDVGELENKGEPGQEEPVVEPKEADEKEEVTAEPENAQPENTQPEKRAYPPGCGKCRPSIGDFCSRQAKAELQPVGPLSGDDGAAAGGNRPLL